MFHFGANDVIVELQIFDWTMFVMFSDCDGIADATLLVAVINHSIISYSNYPLIPNEETTLYMNIIINLYFSWSMSYNYLIMMV